VVGVAFGVACGCVLGWLSDGVSGETGVGILDVADRLPKGGWSADLLTEAPAFPMEAVSEPFGAGGGADVLIILILSPQIRAFTNVLENCAAHRAFCVVQKDSSMREISHRFG
jgi:hypothetical protein